MENEHKVWYLQHNRLFLDADFDLVENSEHLFKMTLFPKRALVFDQGDSARLVYLIKRGKVRLARLTADGKEVTIAVLGAGDVFGEEAILAPGSRTTVAICMEETLICTSRADDLFALLTRDPTLAINVAKVLSERLGDASAAMEDLAYANVSERLMNVFVRLAGEHGVEAPEGIALDLRLTHADIASLIGSTRETVSLELANLVRSGRIKNDGHHIILPKAEIET
jgi:CRP/FNR family cyclic AMP-dependent transcriptional regulator